METLILSAMLSIQKKIALVKSFFRLPDTLYAKNTHRVSAKTYGTINTLGQDMKRDALQLVRCIYRANKSVQKITDGKFFR
jgi:hypothetical protein